MINDWEELQKCTFFSTHNPSRTESIDSDIKIDVNGKRKTPLFGIVNWRVNSTCNTAIFLTLKRNKKVKKKTPIQKLIEQYQRMREEGENDMRTVIYYAEEMRKEEREQLIQAVYRGDEGESSYGSANDYSALIDARVEAQNWFERTYESND